MQWKVCELHRVASLETSLMKGSISHCRAIRHTTREALLSHSYLTRSLRNVMNSNHASCPLLKDSVLRPRRYFRSMGTAFAHLAPCTCLKCWCEWSSYCIDCVSFSLESDSPDPVSSTPLDQSNPTPTTLLGFLIAFVLIHRVWLWRS